MKQGWIIEIIEKKPKNKTESNGGFFGVFETFKEALEWFMNKVYRFENGQENKDEKEIVKMKLREVKYDPGYIHNNGKIIVEWRKSNYGN